MSSVLVRCRVMAATPKRFNQTYSKNAETQEYVQVLGAEASVDFSPVEWPPSSIEQGAIRVQFIGHAAQVFLDRWHAYVTSDDPKAAPPEFYIRFTPVDEVDSGQREA